LVIEESLENSYDGMADDIEELKNDGKIWVIKNDTSHRDILYFVENPLPEDFNIQIGEETKYVLVWL
jgi:hypothetical protein